MNASALRKFYEDLEDKWVHGKCPQSFAFSFTKPLNNKQHYWIDKINEFSNKAKYFAEQTRETYKHPSKKRSKTIVFTNRYFKKISTLRP